MATPEQIKAARKMLEANWDNQGNCGSCGWHASLAEMFVEDSDLEYAIDRDGGVLRMSCQSDDDKATSHRGVRVRVAYVGSEPPKVGSNDGLGPM